MPRKAFAATQPTTCRRSSRWKPESPCKLRSSSKPEKRSRLILAPASTWNVPEGIFFRNATARRSAGCFVFRPVFGSASAGLCRELRRNLVEFGGLSSNTHRVDKVLRQAQDQFPTKERNVNDTLTVQRQRRSATEPRVAPLGATLGCLFQIITNPEWPNEVAPSFTVQLGGTPSGFTAEWAG